MKVERNAFFSARTHLCKTSASIKVVLLPWKTRFLWKKYPLPHFFGLVFCRARCSYLFMAASKMFFLFLLLIFLRILFPCHMDWKFPKVLCWTTISKFQMQLRCHDIWHLVSPTNFTNELSVHPNKPILHICLSLFSSVICYDISGALITLETGLMYPYFYFFLPTLSAD